MITTLTTDQLIMQQLMMRGEPMKVLAISRAVAASETTVRKHVKNLVVTGILVRTEEGTYEMAAAKKAAEPKVAANPRGKRPDSTARDDAVLAFITKAKEPLSKEGVATGLNLPIGIAGLSIWRLKKEGRLVLERVSGSRTPVYKSA